MCGARTATAPCTAPLASRRAPRGAPSTQPLTEVRSPVITSDIAEVTTMMEMETEHVAAADGAEAAGTRESREDQGQRGDQKGRSGSDMVRLTNLAGPQSADIWSRSSTQGKDRRMKQHGRMEHEHKHESRARGQHQRGRECAREHSAGRRMQYTGTGGAAAKGSRWWKEKGRMSQGRMEEEGRTRRADTAA